MRSLRSRNANPALIFHLLVLLLVVASMAAAGGKQVCGGGAGLDAVHCGLQSWAARVLDGGLPELAGVARLP